VLQGRFIDHETTLARHVSWIDNVPRGAHTWEYSECAMGNACYNAKKAGGTYG